MLWLRPQTKPKRRLGLCQLGERIRHERKIGRSDHTGAIRFFKEALRLSCCSKPDHLRLVRRIVTRSAAICGGESAPTSHPAFGSPRIRLEQKAEQSFFSARQIAFQPVVEADVFKPNAAFCARLRVLPTQCPEG